MLVIRGQVDTKDFPLGDVVIAAGTIEGLRPATIRLCPNGDIYVNGRLAANDIAVVEGMRALLEMESKP